MGPGFLSEKDADLILCLLDGLLKTDDLGLGLLHQKLRLQDVSLGTLSAFELDGVQVQHLAVGDQRLSGIIELGIELAQAEIRARDIRYQSCAHYVLAKLGGDQVGAGGLGGSAILAPEIEDVRRLNGKRVEGRSRWGFTSFRKCSILPGPAHGRELVGARNSDHLLWPAAPGWPRCVCRSC